MHTHTCACPLIVVCIYGGLLRFLDLYSEMYSAKIRAASSTLRAQGRVL